SDPLVPRSSGSPVHLTGGYSAKPPTLTDMPVVDLHEKLSLFSDHWSPKVVARINDYEVKVVKLQGEFTWHPHDDTDELFLVVVGELIIQLRDGDVTLSAGQLYVVP